MSKYTSFLLAGATIIAATLFGLRFNSRSGAQPSAPAPVPAPAWELKDVDGQAVTSAQFKGKVVILDFWATWCPPCRAEIPAFVELQKTYRDRGLVVVGVSLDQAGAGIVKDFMKQYGMNYPVVMGDETISRSFGGIEGLPTTLIIDRQGRIVATHVGYSEKQEFEDAIKPLL